MKKPMKRKAPAKMGAKPGKIAPPKATWPRSNELADKTKATRQAPLKREKRK